MPIFSVGAAGGVLWDGVLTAENRPFFALCRISAGPVLARCEVLIDGVLEDVIYLAPGTNYLWPGPILNQRLALGKRLTVRSNREMSLLISQ